MGSRMWRNRWNAWAVSDEAGLQPKLQQGSGVDSVRYSTGG